MGGFVEGVALHTSRATVGFVGLSFRKGGIQRVTQGRGVTLPWVVMAYEMAEMGVVDGTVATRPSLAW